MDPILTFYHLGARLTDIQERELEPEVLRMLTGMSRIDCNYLDLSFVEAVFRVGLINPNSNPPIKDALNQCFTTTLIRNFPNFAYIFHRMGAEITSESSALINEGLKNAIVKEDGDDAYYYHKLGAEYKSDTQSQLDQAFQRALENNKSFEASYFFKMGARPTKTIPIG